MSLLRLMKSTHSGSLEPDMGGNYNSLMWRHERTASVSHLGIGSRVHSSVRHSCDQIFTRRHQTGIVWCNVGYRHESPSIRSGFGNYPHCKDAVTRPICPGIQNLLSDRKRGKE